MDTLRLPFGTIHRLADNRAEVIIDHGVEMDDAIVDEYHQCLAAHMRAPFCVLVNKQHDYSYSFSAMERVGVIPGCRAIAVVAFTPAAELATIVVSGVMGVDGDYLHVFRERSAALAWLDRREHQCR